MRSPRLRWPHRRAACDPDWYDAGKPGTREQWRERSAGMELARRALERREARLITTVLRLIDERDEAQRRLDYTHETGHTATPGW